MDSRLISRPKALPKNLLLKDYLLDDFSSCSSNGFKSFPRRQCCTTVRFLLQNELKRKHHQPQQNKHLNFNISPPKITKNPSKSVLSAFQTVITAVKRLQFAAVSSPEKKRSNNSFLTRNFSKKILKKSFWKRNPNNKEIPRWTSFSQLLKDDSEPLGRSINSVSGDSKSYSLSGSDFTVSTDECSSGHSSSQVNLNLPEEKNHVVEEPEKKVGSNKTVVVTTDDISVESTTSSDGASTNSSTDTKNQQLRNEEKEQFSPVSVLDCPFDDEGEEVSSPFQHRLARLEGTKNKLMRKIHRFESLAQLEPVNLSKCFASLPHFDNQSLGSPSIDEKFISDIEDEQEQEEGNQVEEKAMELFDQLKETFPSYGLKQKSDELVFDFFREKIIDSTNQRGVYSLDEEVGRWINERRGMEKGEEWRKMDQEHEEVALELETEIFDALLDDLLLNM